MRAIVNRNNTLSRIFIIFSAILALFTSNSYAQGAGDTVRFAREDLGISFSYPSTFSSVAPPTPQVLLFIRPSQGRYPTFNVLMQVGNPHVEERSVSELKADVADSYRAVGLYDAGVVQGEKRQIAGRTVFYARVEYKNKDELLTAGVYILPSSQEYFVMTFIDSTEGFVKNASIFDGIAQTLELKRPPPAPTSGRDFPKLLLWIGGILGVLILAKIVQALLGAAKR